MCELTTCWRAWAVGMLPNSSEMTKGSCSRPTPNTPCSRSTLSRSLRSVHDLPVCAAAIEGGAHGGVTGNRLRDNSVPAACPTCLDQAADVQGREPGVPAKAGADDVQPVLDARRQAPAWVVEQLRGQAAGHTTTWRPVLARPKSRQPRGTLNEQAPPHAPSRLRRWGRPAAACPQRCHMWRRSARAPPCPGCASGLLPGTRKVRAGSAYLRREFIGRWSTAQCRLWHPPRPWHGTTLMVTQQCGAECERGIRGIMSEEGPRRM